jgi:hypothetical protein
MDFTGRQMKGFVVVANEVVAEDDALAQWIALATAFVGPMPEKVKAAKPAKPRKSKSA